MYSSMRDMTLREEVDAMKLHVNGVLTTCGSVPRCSVAIPANSKKNASVMADCIEAVAPVGTCSRNGSSLAINCGKYSCEITILTLNNTINGVDTQSAL